MVNRRKFLKTSAGGSLLLGTGAIMTCAEGSIASSAGYPMVISTWDNLKANEAAWKILSENGNALDAVESGVRVVEADPEDTSVGFGGLPDRDGSVTLDACIMDAESNCGSVCFLKNIKHPISVARKVMEKTPHIMLAGEGALQFALENGFQQENLLTDNAREQWEEWKTMSKYQPKAAPANHDTIGMLALDREGIIAGACTTSGMAYKLHGRVGDSPIIGAGLYVDNEVGGATATGVGEEVIRIVGSFLVVELMRQGFTPQAACEEAVKRMIKKQKTENAQVGFLAINKAGEHGAYAIQNGFKYVLYQNNENQTLNSTFAKK